MVRSFLPSLRSRPPISAQKLFRQAYLWILKARIHTWLQIPQVTEYTLLELLHIPHWSSKCLENRQLPSFFSDHPTDNSYLKAENECSHDIRSSDVVESIPKHTSHKFLVRKEKSVQSRVRRCVVVRRLYP